MFQIGDKIFYPMYGAGIVNAIEEREILGETQEYCVINIPICEMDIMIPMATIQKSGVRSIVDRKTMKEILFDFHNVEPNGLLPWKERYKSNMEKMKTGDMHDSVEVVRELLLCSKEKALNPSEKHMLNQARKNLISEIILITDITKNQAADLLKMSS